MKDSEEYSTILKEGKYGVVTGWGFRCSDFKNLNCKPFDTLKQMQMKIQSDEVCGKSVADESKYHEDVMFCAGDKGKKIHFIITQKFTFITVAKRKEL